MEVVNTISLIYIYHRTMAYKIHWSTLLLIIQKICNRRGPHELFTFCAAITCKNQKIRYSPQTSLHPKFRLHFYFRLSISFISTMLTETEAIEIFMIKLANEHQNQSDKVTAAQVARMYGVRDKAVWDIWKGRTWNSETKHLHPDENPQTSDKRSNFHNNLHHPAIYSQFRSNIFPETSRAGLSASITSGADIATDGPESFSFVPCDIQQLPSAHPIHYQSALQLPPAFRSPPDYNFVSYPEHMQHHDRRCPQNLEINEERSSTRLACFPPHAVPGGAAGAASPAQPPDRPRTAAAAAEPPPSQPSWAPWPSADAGRPSPAGVAAIDDIFAAGEPVRGPGRHSAPAPALPGSMYPAESARSRPSEPPPPPPPHPSPPLPPLSPLTSRIVPPCFPPPALCQPLDDPFRDDWHWPTPPRSP